MGKTVICVIERRNSVSTHEDVPQFKMTFLDILFLIYLKLNLNTQIFWVHYQAFFFLELHDCTTFSMIHIMAWKML